jgi:hypothetical protein
MTTQEFSKLALSFPGSIGSPHFDRTAFKIVNKRIFATLHEESGTANLKFSPVDQSVFCSIDKKMIYPVPNKWGLQGWTTFVLKKMPVELMLDALDTAYKEALKSKTKKK